VCRFTAVPAVFNLKNPCASVFKTPILVQMQNLLIERMATVSEIVSNATVAKTTRHYLPEFAKTLQTLYFIAYLPRYQSCGF